MRSRREKNTTRPKTTGCFRMFGKRKKKQAESTPVEMEKKKRWDHPDNLYASKEEQEFCEKFLVCGSMESYSSWHHFSQRLPSYLSEGTHLKMLTEIRQLFGLKVEKSLVASNYYNDHEMREHQPDIEPAKAHEAEIWHVDNIIKLIKEVASHPDNFGADVDALREFAKHFHALLHAIDEFHEFHGFIARYDTKGALEMAQNRLTSFIDELDTEFQADMEIARRRHSMGHE